MYVVPAASRKCKQRLCIPKHEHSTQITQITRDLLQRWPNQESSTTYGCRCVTRLRWRAQVGATYDRQHMEDLMLQYSSTRSLDDLLAFGLSSSNSIVLIFSAGRAVSARTTVRAAGTTKALAQPRVTSAIAQAAFMVVVKGVRDSMMRRGAAVGLCLEGAKNGIMCGGGGFHSQAHRTFIAVPSASTTVQRQRQIDNEGSFKAESWRIV